MARFSDDFNRANNTDLGANWEGIGGGTDPLNLVSNRVRPTTLNTAAFEAVSAITPTNDQFAKISIATISGAIVQHCYVMTRLGAVDSGNTYYSRAKRNDTETTDIVKIVVGTPTQLVSENATTWAATDTILLASIGTNHYCYRNGAILLSATDSAHASGRIGLGAFVGTGGSLANLEGDDFLGGSLVSLFNASFAHTAIAGSFNASM